MAHALGFHIVKTGYGLWLPGDERGHWSTAWDEQIGYIEPHRLHAGDPVRLRMAEELMAHPPVRLTPEMIEIVETTLARCVSVSDWEIAAASLEPTHIHLQLTHTSRDIGNTCKWLAQETTKAIHRQTSHAGPVWARGKWCSFILDRAQWDNIGRYIDNHNIRRGLSAKPYSFLQ